MVSKSLTVNLLAQNSETLLSLLEKSTADIGSKSSHAFNNFFPFISSTDTLFIEIIPVNDYPPHLVPRDSVVHYYENTKIFPFEGINITDEDELCKKDLLYTMEVILENRTATEVLEVCYNMNYYFNKEIFMNAARTFIIDISFFYYSAYLLV